MPDLKFWMNNVASVKFGSSDVKLYLGETLIYPIPVTTEAPSILNANYTPGKKLIPSSVSGTIRNNDAVTAIIYSGISSPPTIDEGTATYNNTVNYIINNASNPGVVYARAQAAGKEMSSIVSLYYE